MSERYLNRRAYDGRWAVKSILSGLKRTVGSMLTSGKPSQLLAEAAFHALAYTLRREGAIITQNVFNRATLCLTGPSSSCGRTSSLQRSSKRGPFQAT